jgi:hypothetical protein
MAETDGKQEPARVSPRRKLPSWAWWTCGGCFGVAAVSAILGVLAWYAFLQPAIEEARDPEQVWERLARDLHYDARPEHIEPSFGFSLAGTGTYTLHDGHTGLFALIQSASSADELEGVLDPDSFKNLGSRWSGEFENPEPGSLELQGRAVELVRFSASHGPGVRLLIAATSGRALLVNLFGPDGEQRIDDETVREFFAPFDVWRGRD